MSVNRIRIKERQSELFQALFEGSPAPEDVASERIELLRNSLLHKRAGVVGRRWPYLKQQLGEHFFEAFSEHAIKSAGEFKDEVLFDGVRFAREVYDTCGLNLDAVQELVAGELHLDRRLSLRKSIKGNWVIGVRLPLLGRQVLALGRE